jgi:heme-degrading monooxygenase HmoA
MILEVAQIDIHAGEAPRFEEAMDRALALLADSKGFRGAKLFRSHEIRGRYHLFVNWDSIENHLVDWQKSDAFQSWRDLLQSYFVELPRVEHMMLVHNHPELRSAEVQVRNS